MKHMSLIGDERIINLQRTKVHVFSDSVFVSWEDPIRIPNLNKAWKERIGWITSSQSYRNFDGIDGEPRNSSGTSSQDLIRCSSATKSKVY